MTGKEPSNRIDRRMLLEKQTNLSFHCLFAECVCLDIFCEIRVAENMKLLIDDKNMKHIKQFYFSL